MTAITLVYPYFRPSSDRSIFRYPPLGLGYIAAYLKKHDISVDIVDCTFLSQKEALEKIKHSNPKNIGIYSMFSMRSKSIELAKLLKDSCEFLVAGGPLPTSNPKDFLKFFDIVVIGEGEETTLQLISELEGAGDLSRVKGIAYREKDEIKLTPSKEFLQDLDQIPFPARELFDNEQYKNHYSRRFGYKATNAITSRGCPFNCDFCSRPVFGNHFRTRSAANIVDEIEEVMKLGYDRVSFSDDCFTSDRKRLIDICDEIVRRGVSVGWDCLSRVDRIDLEVARKMKQAGCVRTYFGLESGNNTVLSLMKKQITTEQAEEAVRVAKASGIQVGAFFILGYPGETDETVLDTVRFASSLPLDYVSFTLPYPIPGTPLYARMKDKLISDDLESRHLYPTRHKLLYRSSFSEAKIQFAVMKAAVQFRMKRGRGKIGADFVSSAFERITDSIFRLLP